MISDLETRLEKFPYWKERFEQYDLSPEHLKTKSFNFSNIENEKFEQVFIGKNIKEYEHRVK